jgi:hypothetical protein
MSNPPLIDSHQHVHWSGMPPEKHIEYLDSLGVDKAWLHSVESVDGGLAPAYRHLPVEFNFEAAEQFPDRYVVFAGYDPRRTNAEQLLRDAHARGARGYGEIKLRICYDNPDFLRMLGVAGELGMPATLHLQYPTQQQPMWFGGRIGAIERAARACPGTNIIGHAQSWWAHISGDGQAEAGELYPAGKVEPGGEVPRLLGEYDNLYADISAGSGMNALTRDPEFGRQFLIDFADKLLYGVDMYDDRLLKLLREWDLPGDVFAKIAGGNAMKLIAD